MKANKYLLLLAFASAVLFLVGTWNIAYKSGQAVREKELKDAVAAYEKVARALLDNGDDGNNLRLANAIQEDRIRKLEAKLDEVARAIK